MTTVASWPLDDTYHVPRLINGGWQLSAGHQPQAKPTDQVVPQLMRLADAGLTTFDCADIYTGVEECFGHFRRVYLQQRGEAALSRLRFHTKCVPDASLLGRLRRDAIRATVERSLQRLGLECLDLVQFHWWDYDAPGYVEAAFWLQELQDEGKIHRLGATNFDVTHLQEMVAGGIRFTSHQIQYSLLDRRPTHGMVDFCREHGIGLLCYGSLAGGFLTDAYLGRDDDVRLHNRSLVKYRLIVDEFGGWSAFQNLLQVLQAIGNRHGVSIANVAVAWLLDQPGVSAAIVGARNADRLHDNLRVFQCRLTADDHREIQAVLDQHPGPPGDTFGLERIKGGPHQVIMKTNLNKLYGV